jgi:NAD(P)-dependent dehydrogenase (short-subunit alcohol dehydrogenase family)
MKAGPDLAVTTRKGFAQDEFMDPRAVEVAVSDQVRRRNVQATQQEFEWIDVLVNSAGIGGIERLEVMSDQTRDGVIKTNRYGTFYSCHEVVRMMIQQQAGSIINAASVAGVKGTPGFGAHAASKSGVMALTKVLALSRARPRARQRDCARLFSHGHERRRARRS